MFTQKERDTESGLDYFLARYYSSAQGRFTSPDEFQGGPLEVPYSNSSDSGSRALAYADVVSPQSLNKYVYCLNNPLLYVDPDGHDWRITEEKNEKGNWVKNYVWDRNYTHQEGDEGGVGMAGAGGTRYYEYVDTQGRAINLWGDPNKDPDKGEVDHGYQVVTINNKDTGGDAIYSNGKGEAPSAYVFFSDAKKAVLSAGYTKVWDPEPSHKGGQNFMTKRSPTLHITLYPKHQIIEHQNPGGVTYTQRYINERSTFHVDKWTLAGSWKHWIRHLKEYLNKK